jgi:hypothetical protein
MTTEHVVQVVAPTIEMGYELPVEARAMIQRSNNQNAWLGLLNAYELLREGRPNDRSPADRYFAVTITEMEKVMAYFRVFVLDGYAGEAPSTRNYAYTVPAGENGAPLCPYCAEEMIWTRIETHDKSGWIKGWLCGCQFEDAVTEAVS